MNAIKCEMLRVPGASIFYEVRGSGPLLLMYVSHPRAFAEKLHEVLAVEPGG